MKSFSFSLEGLLRLRTQLKEQALQAWMLALRELKEVTMERDRIRVLLKSWQVIQREKQSTFVFAGELRRSHEASAALYQQWLAQETLRQRVEQRVRLTLEQLTEARRKEEILENLKKRYRMTWRKEHSKEEQKLSDERAGVMAFFRMTREAI